MPAKLPDFDVYAELEVDVHASVAAIRAAYRRLAKNHHPDIAKDKRAAATRMTRLNQARDALCDPALRAEFDSRRASGGAPTAGRRPGSGGASPGSASRAKEQRRRAERDKKEREDAARADRERNAREAAQKADRERKAREAAAKAERDRRSREAATKAERERRARAAAAKAERKARANQLRPALLDDDIAMLALIHADGSIEWSSQRASVRFQVDRAVVKQAAIEELQAGLESGERDAIRMARRWAAATGADVPSALNHKSRDAMRSKPVLGPTPSRSRTRAQSGARAQPADQGKKTAEPAAPDEYAVAVQALHLGYNVGEWPEAARAWMTMRARWPEQVTPELRAKGEDAVLRWGESLETGGVG